MEFSTQAIHCGCSPEKETGAVMPPIYMTSTFMQKAPGVHQGYEYTRAGNPNFTILEEQIAPLEQARFATVFSSGLGALTAMASTLSQGDSVLALGSVYGGTFRLFNTILKRYGIRWLSATMDTLDQQLEQKPKWLLFETPTNPLLEIYDIQEVSQKARRHGVLTIVDNTFATPYFQNPLSLGAAVVWHSSTKYLGGHSDVIGGVVLSNDANWKEQMDFARKAMGLNPSPFDCWLLTRGIKTLAVRMKQHEHNALSLVQFFAKHPHVEKLYYPGLPNHPGHEIAKKQMRGFSGIFSAEFAMNQKNLFAAFENLKVFTLAESLGGVESLVCHPATMTHASIPPDERKKMGLSDSLVRFSVGIEDPQDLEADLEKLFT